MPKYIKEIPEYVPGIQPWRPNLQLYQNVLTRRQQQFNAGHEKVDSLYNSIFNADLVRPDDIKKRDEFLKLADNEIKRLSSVDLSNPANKKAAYSIFKPFYEDDNIIHDIGHTKHVKQAYQDADAARKCIGDDCPEFWNGSLEYINYKQQEYINSSDEEALSMSAPNFISKQNVSIDGLKLIKDAGLKNTSIEFSDDNRWMYTVKNGETFIPTVNSFLQATLGSDPKYLDYYNAKSYVGKKHWMDQNSMKYQSDDLAEERYAKEVLDKSDDIFTDEQMQNNITSNIIDHKQSRMEEWLNQGNVPMPSEVKNMKENASQKQIVEAEKQRLVRIKQLQDAYGINVNDPSTYVGIIDQINANNLLSYDIAKTAEAYAMGTKEITGLKANPYKLESIRHSNKMLEINARNYAKYLKKQKKKVAEVKKAKDKALEREVANSERGGAKDKLITGVDKSEDVVINDKSIAQDNVDLLIDDDAAKIKANNKLEDLSDKGIQGILDIIVTDHLNAPIYFSALVDNVYQDIFSTLSLEPDHNADAYNNKNEGKTLYYHYTQGQTVGEWNIKPWNQYDIEMHQKMANQDGKEFGVAMANNIYGRTRDVLSGDKNILRDFEGNAYSKINSPWNIRGQQYDNGKFSTSSNEDILQQITNANAVINLENKQSLEIVSKLNTLLKGSGISSIKTNTKPTPQILYKKKLELQNWLTSKDRTPIEVKQFNIDLKNFYKNTKLIDVDYETTKEGVNIKTSNNIDAEGVSIGGDNSSHSFLKLIEQITGTAVKAKNNVAEKFGIIPTYYVNNRNGITQDQLRNKVSSVMRDVNKLTQSQNNLADRKSDELMIYNNLFTELGGNVNPTNHNKTDDSDKEFWSHVSNLFLPKVNGRQDLYPVSEEEFIAMYTAEALRGVDGHLSVSPSNPGDWFDADVNYTDSGPGKSFIGSKGYSREDSDALFFSDDDGYDYMPIGYSKKWINEQRKYDPSIMPSDINPRTFHKEGILHDAKLAYRTLQNKYMDMYYTSATNPKIGITSPSTPPGLKSYGGGNTYTSKPLIDPEVKNNEIYSDAYMDAKQYVETFLDLSLTDDNANIVDGVNKDYTVAYANGESGSIPPSEILTLLKHVYFDPSDVTIMYDKNDLPYYSGELFNTKGELTDESKFSVSTEFNKLKNGNLELTLIPSPELVNKPEFKGKRKTDVDQNRAAVKGGIVLTIPKHKVDNFIVNKKFGGQMLNNGLALGFTIDNWSSTAGIVSVDEVKYNSDKREWEGPAYIVPKNIRNNSQTGEPEYFNDARAIYNSNESYKSADEMYNILYNRVMEDDAVNRHYMNAAIELYKKGLDIAGKPLKSQNNATE